MHLKAKRSTKHDLKNGSPNWKEKQSVLMRILREDDGLEQKRNKLNSGKVAWLCGSSADMVTQDIVSYKVKNKMNA